MAPEKPLGGSLEENERLLRQAVGQQRGSVFQELPLPGAGPGLRRNALLVYFEVQIDSARMELLVTRPLLEGEVTVDEIPSRLPPSSVKMKDLTQALAFMYRGKVLVMWDGCPDVWAIEVALPPYRPIESPETETSISGPRESFVELLVINLSILRRRFPGPDLKVESLWIGSQAPLEAVIIHLNGRPTPTMVNTVRDRLKKVVQDGIQDVTELQEAVADTALSVFPTVLVTERPDMVCHYLKAGRVVVMIDNSPRALVLPAVFVDFFTSADDFYEWRPFVVFLRLLRFMAFNIAVPLPALYVSVTTYHLQALPTQLTLSLLAQREGAPLPPPIEAAVMTLTFEILREAGIRLPRAIGPTVSIVGGLVIGDAAIRSGLTSPAMVLVVSATAVATFSLPSTTLANAATYYRFFVLALASGFGFFGLLLGYLVALANVSSMTSLGVPYMTPLLPLMLKHIVAALGLKVRPPQGVGAAPDPEMVRTAVDYQEEGGSQGGSG